MPGQRGTSRTRSSDPTWCHGKWNGYLFGWREKGWTLDQMGRIALSGGSEEYKPSEEGVVEFQKGLDSALRGKGF